MNHSPLKFKLKFSLKTFLFVCLLIALISSLLFLKYKEYRYLRELTNEFTRQSHLQKEENWNSGKVLVPAGFSKENDILGKIEKLSLKQKKIVITNFIRDLKFVHPLSTGVIGVALNDLDKKESFILPILLEHLNAPNKDKQIALIYIIGYSHDSRGFSDALKFLIPFLDKTDEDYHSAVFSALSFFSRNESFGIELVFPLIKLLQHKNWRIRYRTIKLISELTHYAYNNTWSNLEKQELFRKRLKEKDLLEPLIKMSKDKNEDIRAIPI